MSDVAIILAAGRSTRLGQPKQLLVVGGESLVARAVRIARAAELVPVVVTGHAAAEVAAEVDVATVFNPRFAEGVGTSIAAAVAANPDATTFTVLTCDQLRLEPGDLRRLHDALEPNVDAVAAAYEGILGVPAVFTSSCRVALASLDGDTGARDLLRRGGLRVVGVELPNAAFDIDEPGDVEASP